MLPQHKRAWSWQLWKNVKKGLRWIPGVRWLRHLLNHRTAVLKTRLEHLQKRTTVLERSLAVMRTSIQLKLMQQEERIRQLVEMGASSNRAGANQFAPDESLLVVAAEKR
jgi:hypothetical protein